MHLLSSGIVACSNTLNRINHQIATTHHQFIVHRAHGVILADRHLHLTDNSTLIYLMIEQKGGNTCLLLAIDHSPVNRRCTTILGQQRRMQVEGSIFWHCPDNLGQHTERNDNTQIGLQLAHSLHKGLIAQTLRL